MNLMNRMMSYDKTKLNQECNCDEYASTDIAKSENRIVEYPKLSEEEGMSGILYIYNMLLDV